jgi:hypothetical protein
VGYTVASFQRPWLAQKPGRQAAVLVSDPMNFVMTRYVQRSEVLDFPKPALAFES